MSSSNVEPYDKMRARAVGRVARGEQLPRPAHEPGSISEAPPHPEDDCPFKVLEILTAPADIYTFPIHKPDSSLLHPLHRVPQVVQWNEERELGIFPGPL